jgi:dolichol-phosphate mannosyltransferase
MVPVSTNMDGSRLSPSVAVVIPAFNEGIGIGRCVRTVLAELPSLPLRSTLIVVNDGSADGTLSALQQLRAEGLDFHLVDHPVNRGYGEALKTGGREAEKLGYEYVLFMDSDLTNDPKEIRRFAEKMRGGSDCIKGSRYIEGSRIEGVPRFRVIISRVGNSIARLLFNLPIHDCTNGFRAIRASLFNKLPLQENRFPVIMEELYHLKKMGATLAEVPTSLTDRAGDLRPTSFSYRPSTFYRYLKYPMRSFFRI